MAAFKVTRADLKGACDEQTWDLLDKLLECDRSMINDNSLYADTWGEWWGLLLEAVRTNSTEGVRVLLKHGAQRDNASWGDCIPCTPMEAARDKPEILALLLSSETPDYIRATDPPLPERDAGDEDVNRQGEIRDATGLVFQTDAFKRRN